jgi:xylulokinase
MDMWKLPKIVEPWHVVGEVTEEGAKDLGLAPGTVVAAGAGDTASNALGAGIVRPGMLFDVAGTAAVLAGCTDKYVADIENHALLTMRSIIPGLWNPLAYIAGGGIALRWIRDEIYYPSLNREASEDDLYDEIMTLAEKVTPGADGLFFSPHLGGRICPSSPKMRGAWVGLSWSHKQAHLIRAVLESVAFEYAYYLKILRGLLPELSLIETRAMGGGAKSRAWNQIKANVLGVPYYRLKADELGTWGAAMIAGKAAGLIDNIADHAEKCAKIVGEPSIPDKELHQAYQPMIEKYIDMELLLEQFFSR